MYIAKPILSLITDKDTGKCRYMWIKASELMNTSDKDIHVNMH